MYFKQEASGSTAKKEALSLLRITHKELSLSLLILTATFPDDLMIEILEHTLDTNSETAKGVIFDGFPRTIEQAKALNKMLERRGSKVHAVVGLEVSEPELFDRLVKRGKESGRSDDNPETISNRLKVYHAQTSPLQEFYKTEGKYHGVKGEGTIDEIFQLIKKELEPTRPAE